MPARFGLCGWVVVKKVRGGGVHFYQLAKCPDAILGHAAVLACFGLRVWEVQNVSNLLPFLFYKLAGCVRKPGPAALHTFFSISSNKHRTHDILNYAQNRRLDISHGRHLG